MKYAPTLTDQKFNSPLSINSPARYVLGRMQYDPTKTRYVSVKYVLIESFSRQGLDSPSLIESYTRQKFDYPLKHPTRNDPFFVYRCRGVLHTPHKYPWQWANDLSARYVSVKYVLIESFSRQKLDSPLKSLTHNDPFLVYRCRVALHTPHKYPW